MKVYIDTRCDIRYAVFYIYGLYKIFGKRNVKFSNQYTSQISFDESKYVIDRILLCTFVENGKIIKKIAIDSRDPRSFIEKAYDWCDIYCKTNYRKDEESGKHIEKLLLLPPSFGFRLWNPFMTIIRGIQNTWLTYRTKNYGTLSDLKITLRNYIWLIVRRTYLSAYTVKFKKLTNINGGGYAFLIASLWNYKECIRHTNKLRHQFICMLSSNKQVQFEGGFVVHSLSAEIPDGWKQFCFHKRVKPNEYILKTKKSFCVFNTPAVRECHGWKLPEFLAMGKAIISTPLLNDLPVTLESGKELLIVNNKRELENAINLLLTDSETRSNMERASRIYWNNTANPEAVIKSILQKF